MRRIAFLVSSLDFGGAQRAVSNISLALGQRYHIDIILNDDSDVLYPYCGEIISLNVKNNGDRKNLWYQARVLVKRYIYLNKARRSNRYDAVISFLDSANIVNIICNARKCSGGPRTIISIRTSPSETSKRRKYYKYTIRPFAMRLYKRSDVVVSVSEELKNELIGIFGLNSDRVIAIPNGFDVHDIQKRASEEIDEDVKRRITGKKVVFTAGRLGVAKCHWHLIRAFSRVKEAVPDAVLMIAGNGELEEYLYGLTETLGLKNDVIFLGFEKNVYRYIKQADVFVFPSGFEGFPNALGEAMCVGAPCVITDFRTGAREILAPELLPDHVVDAVTYCEFGIMTPVCSGIMYKGWEPLEREESELAKAVILMITDSGLNERYRAKSIERSRNLDISSVADKWTDVIEEGIESFNQN